MATQHTLTDSVRRLSLLTWMRAWVLALIVPSCTIAAALSYIALLRSTRGPSRSHSLTIYTEITRDDDDDDDDDDEEEDEEEEEEEDEEEEEGASSSSALVSEPSASPDPSRSRRRMEAR